MVSPVLSPRPVFQWWPQPNRQEYKSAGPQGHRRMVGQGHSGCEGRTRLVPEIRLRLERQSSHTR